MFTSEGKGMTDRRALFHFCEQFFFYQYCIYYSCTSTDLFLDNGSLTVYGFFGKRQLFQKPAE